MPKIALVDDDRNILTSVSLTLEAEGGLEGQRDDVDLHASPRST